MNDIRNSKMTEGMREKRIEDVTFRTSFHTDKKARNKTLSNKLKTNLIGFNRFHVLALIRNGLRFQFALDWLEKAVWLFVNLSILNEL